MKAKKRHVSSESNHDLVVDLDNSDEAQRTVYVKGLNCDLITQVKRNPKKNSLMNSTLHIMQIFKRIVENRHLYN